MAQNLRNGHEVMMRLSPLIAVAAICLACSPTGSIEQGPPDLETADYITYNSLAPGALTGNANALSALATASLAGATTDLVGSESGRSLLSYVVRCAVPEGGSASFPRPGDVDLVLPGLLGFVPAWLSGPLDAQGQRLMTGCLMAHVNAFQIQVPISVRAGALGSVSPEEASQFPAQELAAYGNIFLADPAARQLNVCFGEAVASALGLGGGLGNGRPTYLDLRICSTDAQCGFNRVSACYRWPLFEAIETTACETLSDSVYNGCHQRPIEVEETPDWNEPVSVYLQQEDMDQMVEEYRELACSTAPSCDGGVCPPTCDGGLCEAGPVDCQATEL
jgi:hypothetical protein